MTLSSPRSRTGPESAAKRPHARMGTCSLGLRARTTIPIPPAPASIASASCLVGSITARTLWVEVLSSKESTFETLCQDPNSRRASTARSASNGRRHGRCSEALWFSPRRGPGDRTVRIDTPGRRGESCPALSLRRTRPSRLDPRSTTAPVTRRWSHAPPCPPGTRAQVRHCTGNTAEHRPSAERRPTIRTRSASGDDDAPDGRSSAVFDDAGAVFALVGLASIVRRRRRNGPGGTPARRRVRPTSVLRVAARLRRRRHGRAPCARPT